VRFARRAWIVELTLAVVAILAAWHAAAQSLPIENIQLRGDRFRGLHYREMSEEQRALLYNVVNSARAVTNATGNGPFNTLLRTPQVGELSQQLGNAIRFSSGLSGRLRELATLMAGRAWTSTYEWYAHARYALDEGIAPSVVAAIAAHRTPDLASMPVEDAMVWRVSDELLYTRRITDATYAEALAVLGEQRLFSTVTIAAYYEYVSMLLNVDRYPLPVDAPAEAAAAARALLPLTAAEMYRPPRGAVTPRPSIRLDNIDKAVNALGTQVRGATLGIGPPNDRFVRDVALEGVLSHWKSGNRGDRDHAMPQAAFIASRFVGELLTTRFVSDATFAAAREAFGESGLVNLMILVGQANIRCAQQALAGSACVL
jgi:4-carboxymuconolactone decarboxylase